ncbi:MAG: hypothetical protein ACLR2O_00405 [Coprococcus sp.]
MRKRVEFSCGFSSSCSEAVEVPIDTAKATAHGVASPDWSLGGNLGVVKSHLPDRHR